ncbi:thiopeptide-type bacteriocin biosynthesis protein [Streptomyces sp. WMMB303]|uniref:thiopeptide-type bacteriocin biosynthesis protein n=1 Tax=Streptomyces sp. WMMB303 TaxID=3034154 RepID=UPI0023EC8799|nr:thiopeptide-type bacteriocin biosynthesis protein [Streptomyces sp. WMMB303]MDF4250013.1 thiopeptide-type bacteriocin biosynthesis protein [Streptomyces sp. WMMB303]
MPEGWYLLRPARARPAAGGRLRELRSRGRAALSAGLTAGLAAARDAEAGAPWVQVNLTVARDARARAEFCAELGVVAREFLGAERARNFFFTHRDPAVRVRFQAFGPQDAAELRAALLHRFARCRGARTRPVPVVYEHEHYLFGGPSSMSYAHDLFSVDSFAWLDHHARHPGGEDRSAAWRHSLLILRELFAGLGIVGREHRGVWHALSRQAGAGPRGFAVAGARAAREQAATRIAAYWHISREEALDAFPAEHRAALARHAEAVRKVAARWREGYFEAGRATVGPRTAAACFTASHWNRGRLSPARRRLLTHVLAAEDRGPHQAPPPRR